MNVESRPAEKMDGQENGDTQPDGAQVENVQFNPQLNPALGSNAAKLASDVPAAETTGRTRLVSFDPRGSESTRGLRDTARRRRDAEEKLQRHLLEAKDHIPNVHHGQAATTAERRT